MNTGRQSRGLLTVFQLPLVLLVAVGALGQSIPRVDVESLNGRPVSLPKDFANKPAIFVIGFSQGGGNQCGHFARKLAKEASVVEGKVVMYQIAMLESAPRIFRSMILHGMRSGIPSAEQERFLPLFHDEAQWKQLVGFNKSAPNDAYLLLVSQKGAVLWTGHGTYSDELFSELKKHLP
jgi:hypothetical protein